MTALASSAPLRGTQSLVGFMGWAFRRPSLTALEVAWRWLFGIPVLVVCWRQAQQIVAAFPIESSGFNSIDPQNPWVAILQLANVADYEQPPFWSCIGCSLAAIVGLASPASGATWC